MTEKVFETERGSIHYWINSDAPGKLTLVFLPGLTADHRLFRQQIACFEGRYPLLVWDAPGHYLSRPFQLDFTLMDKAAWLHAILEKEHMENIVLIGQSMGGYVSQCYMERYPGTVKGFVSIDSAPLQKKYMTGAEIWMLKHTEAMYRAYPWKALKKAGTKGCSETEYGRQLMAEMMDTYDKEYYVKLASHGYRILGEAVEADLPYQIHCPALLLCGVCDKAGSTKRYNLAWTKAAGIPLQLIPDAGHNSNTDNPEAVNGSIAAFLEEIER